MVRAGDLSEKIQVIRLTEATYSGAYVDKMYTDPNYVEVTSMHTHVQEELILETLSHVEELDFQNDMVAFQEDWKETLLFTIRYRPEIAIRNGDTIQWRGRRWEITGQPTQRMKRREIKMTARWQG